MTAIITNSSTDILVIYILCCSFTLDFAISAIPLKMLESWWPNLSGMNTVASVLFNLRGQQSGQGEKAHSVTVLNHVTKLQIPFIHLSPQIQSAVLLEPHVFIPQSCLDCSRAGFFLNIAIFVWAQSDTCGHIFFSGICMFFQHLWINSLEKHLGIKCGRRKFHCTV